MRPLLKRSLYADLLLLLVTGIVYAIPRYLDRHLFINIDSPLSGSTLMALHGLGGFVFLYLFGYLTRCHIQVHLRGQQHLYSGLIMLTVLSILSFSGYFLYYLGDEVLRTWSADIHVVLGLILPITLFAHRLHNTAAKQLRGTLAYIAGKPTQD